MESLPPNNSPPPLPDELPQRSAWSRSNLTLSQWQIWHEQRRRSLYSPLSALSPLTAAFTFHTALDMRLFRQAFQSVVERSDALRTVFVEEDGVPQRYVLPRLPLAMEIVDLSAAYQPAAAYAQWMAERDLRPLSAALCPFDSTLLRLGEQHYVWRLALHRLIADSRSLFLVYRHTADAYAAAAAGGATALPPLPPFEEYARSDRQQVSAAVPLEGHSSLRPQGRFSRSLPVPGEHYALDLGVTRTAALRRMAGDLTLAGDTAGDAAVFLLAAAALAALLARLRGCRTAGIAADLDLRHLGPWQETIGRISRGHTLIVENAAEQSLPALVKVLGQELAKARRVAQVADGGERPAPICSAFVQIDDMAFPPFAGAAVKAERLDACYGQRKLGELRETRMEPSLCLRLEGYAGPEDLRAVFTFCSGHSSQERGPQLAHEYMRLLDALLSGREQPIQSLRWGQ